MINLMGCADLIDKRVDELAKYDGVDGRQVALGSQIAASAWKDYHRSCIWLRYITVGRTRPLNTVSRSVAAIKRAC